MSDTQASPRPFSLPRRILRTPLGQLLRGQLIPPTPAQTVTDLLTSSSLPTPATDLISRVTRRTRLWRSERLAVAAELISHFADGLDVGTPLETLLSRFGDEPRAARLIRRAKRRNRPLIWHAWRFLRAGFLVLCLFYAFLAAYYYSGKPAPSVDYVAILNRSVLATPVDQRAWPVYRQVILDLDLISPAKAGYNNDFSRMLDAIPGSKRWTTLLAWLEQHRPAIDQLHRAADRPQFGFVLGLNGSMADPAVFPGQLPPVDAAMYDVAMPSLTFLRQFARILAADAAAACQADDRTRFLRDVRSLLQLSDQTRQHPSIVADLVSLGIRALTYECIGQTLASPHVAMLTDDDLRDLAHRLATPRDASEFFDLKCERMFFHDTVQRMYTAGGPGGGRITPAAFRLGRQYIGTNAPDPVPAPIINAVLPAITLFIASRDEELRLYDGLLDQAESLLHQPLRHADWDAWDRRASDLKTFPFGAIRNYPIGVFLPSLARMPVTAERCLGVRDGLLCALALETYRRHHDGSYPATLDALTPSLLPAVPPDRITGDPIHYLLKDGRPLLYSLGDDHIDNHGQPPAKYEFDAAQWNSKNPTQGDWVLYPPRPPVSYDDSE